jgi:chromate transporter
VLWEALAYSSDLGWARRIAAEQHRWINEKEVTKVLSLYQLMPGPNVVGIAVCVGIKLRGSIGAIAAVTGFVLIPWTIGFPLGVLYLQHTHLTYLQDALGGVSAAGSGLLIATGIKMLMPQRTRPQAMVIAALAAGGMLFTKLPLLIIL